MNPSPSDPSPLHPDRREGEEEEDHPYLSHTPVPDSCPHSMYIQSQEVPRSRRWSVREALDGRRRTYSTLPQTDLDREQKPGEQKKGGRVVEQ